MLDYWSDHLFLSGSTVQVRFLYELTKKNLTQTAQARFSVRKALKYAQVRLLDLCSYSALVFRSSNAQFSNFT